MSPENKKLVLSTLIMVITLVMLVMGAAYAYFSADNTIDNNTTKIETTIEDVGIVSLKAGKDLSLNISAVQMMKQTGDVEYYATESGTPSTSANTVAIATADVEGNGTMSCNYQLKAEISGTNNMYTVLNNMSTKSVGQLVLNVDGVEYDFYSTTFPKTITGTLTGLKEGSPKNIMASFKVVNKSSIDQSDLAGTDLTITFAVEQLNCNLVG